MFTTTIGDEGDMIRGLGITADLILACLAYVFPADHLIFSDLNLTAKERQRIADDANYQCLIYETRPGNTHSEIIALAEQYKVGDIDIMHRAKTRIRRVKGGATGGLDLSEGLHERCQFLRICCELYLSLDARRAEWDGAHSAVFFFWALLCRVGRRSRFREPFPCCGASCLFVLFIALFTDTQPISKTNEFSVSIPGKSTRVLRKSPPPSHLDDV